MGFSNPTAAIGVKRAVEVLEHWDMCMPADQAIDLVAAGLFGDGVLEIVDELERPLTTFFEGFGEGEGFAFSVDDDVGAFLCLEFFREPVIEAVTPSGEGAF